MTDSEKLKLLAEWFYLRFPQCDRDDVQRDLLQIARRIEMAEIHGQWNRSMDSRDGLLGQK
jgi:hypothetical protein